MSSIPEEKIDHSTFEMLHRRLRRAYQLAEIAWWEFDVASQTFTCSDEIFFMYGNPVPENNQITIKEFLSLVHPDDVPRLRHDLSVISQDSYFNYEHRVIKPSGEVIHVIHYSEVIRDNAGNAVSVHGTAKNISVRKYYHELEKLEREILEMNALPNSRLQDVLSHYMKGVEALHPGIFCSLLEKRGNRLFNLSSPNLPHTFLNEMEGLETGGEICSCGTAAILKEKVVVSDFQRNLKWANLTRLAKQHQLNDGLSTPIVDFSGNIVAVFAVYHRQSRKPSSFEDNTIQRTRHLLQVILENKKQQEALKLASERYEIASRVTSDALWDWDLLSNNCYLSKSFTTLFGYENISDLAYANWIGNIQEADREKVWASVEASLQDPSATQWEGEYCFHRSDGSIAHIWDRGFIIRNSEGKAVRMVGTMQDITKLKEAEGAMAKNERRFKAMVQSGKDLIMLLNPSFEVMYTSPNHMKVTGYTHEELGGLLAHDKVHPDDYPALINASKNIFTTSSATLPLFRVKTKNGDYRWFEAALSNHLPNPDIEAIVANIRDVTERVNAEREMKKLSLVAKETVNAVVITDAKERITWVNQAFTNITEYSFDEAVGKKPGELLQGANTNKRTISYLRKCVEYKRPFNCEIINYTKSGRAYWMDIKGQPIFDEKGELSQFFAIQTDITDRKEAEEAIKTSEEKYKRLFYNTPRPKWIFNAETLKVVNVNNAAIELYGYSREEFLTLRMHDIIHAGDALEMLAAIGEMKSRKSVNINKILCHKKKNGETFYIEITSFPIELASGVHLMVTGIDMTEKLYLQQKLIEEKVSAQKEKAKAVIQAQEKERSQIAGELHDNVCQLLTTAKLYIENIRYFPEQQDEFLTKGVDLLLKSINEIRFLSKQLVTPVMRDIGFKATIEELIGHYQSLNLFQITFQYEVCERSIDNDLKLTIYRILQEQFNNTVKYAKASAVVVVLKSTRAALQLHYQDNGIGFDPALNKNGLGLKNIQSRTDAFKGKVQLASAVGDGCTINISFPIPYAASHN